MHLSRLQIHHVRNLANVALMLHPQCNIFVGSNGSGKTSLLEAIYLLTVGRSFRSRQMQSVITYDQAALSCFGEVKDEEGISIPLGIQKNRLGETLCKIRGESCPKLSIFASLLPVQLMIPDTFKLLTAGPQERRHFLDWGVFHVEPPFAHIFKRYQRLLKQRNASLKLARHLPVFEPEFVAMGEEIHRARADYIAQLSPLIQQVQQGLLPDHTFTIDYEKGWPNEVSLSDSLTSQFAQDQRIGFTGVGPHLADLRILVDHFPAQQVLSRGQLKLLIIALMMAQARHLQAYTGKKCLYLIDDLASELDAHNRQRVLEYLFSQQHQVFLTAVDASNWHHLGGLDAYQLFHVEQGSVILPLSLQGEEA